jgi:hypothetical protein
VRHSLRSAPVHCRDLSNFALPSKARRRRELVHRLEKDYCPALVWKYRITGDPYTDSRDTLPAADLRIAAGMDLDAQLHRRNRMPVPEAFYASTQLLRSRMVGGS